MDSIVEALALLTPFDIDIPKRRMGPASDGGYVFADRISPDQSILSYGIGTEYGFDREMAEAGHSVYMFDHTINGIVKAHEKMMWFREGVAGISNPSERLYSIEDCMSRHGIEGNRLVLKMDVEGAEFDALGLISDNALLRFEQIVFEVHNLSGCLADPSFRRQSFTRLFRNLNRHFTLFHVHANNFESPEILSIVSGMPVPSLLELSYIKTDVVKRSTSKTLYPTTFDFPNNADQKEKLLWFFPFLPTYLSLADFALCEDRISLLDRLRKGAPSYSGGPMDR